MYFFLCDKIAGRSRASRPTRGAFIVSCLAQIFWNEKTIRKKTKHFKFSSFIAFSKHVLSLMFWNVIFIGPSQSLHRPCVLTDQLVAAFWRCWSLCDYINEIRLIILYYWLYNCYIELSTSLSTLWFRVSTLRAWLKAKGLPLLGELLADSVSVLEDWTDWTSRVAFVKSFHLANLQKELQSLFERNHQTCFSKTKSKSL